MNQHVRKIGIFFVDGILINIAIVIAYFMRFGRYMPMEYLQVYFKMALFVTIAKILVYYYMGMYRPIWKYANIDEMIHLFFSICAANGLVIIGIFLLRLTVPRSIYIIATLVDFVLIGSSRFIKQIYNRLTLQDMVFARQKAKRVMIIGAGEAGVLLIQEFKNHPALRMVPVCIIDDSKSKIGRRINGVPVIGSRSMIPYLAMAKNIDQIIIAIPSIKSKDLSEIVDECKKTKCEVKILPSIHEIHDVTGDMKEILFKKMRNVDIDDLLGRDPITLDVEEISQYIQDQVVLVTGGGGSIGSELCRQIARLRPGLLVILDISEENCYSIQNELKMVYPELCLQAVIANIRESERVDEIFESYQPNIVFHAAAHKHVPLMEDHPQEAIKNNVLGTWNVIQAAHRTGVRRFILISTDKAVNPTNVMGATKRICEMMIQAMKTQSSTEFVAVRFGNVLGSSGSVIPLFKKQIERGGPVTVTHPEIIRYFMTIPEAVQLVLQAGAMAKGGEIFVLDMGEPVKIDKLARDLIRLSGFEPDVDIQIRYTGLRPGEKLYEELLMAEEGLKDTRYEKIHVAKPMEISMEDFVLKLEKLENVITKDKDTVIKTLQETVPTYIRNE